MQVTSPAFRARVRNLPRHLLWGNWLTHVVVTRRCNLSCGYCNEFDKVSEAVPYGTLCRVVDKLVQLGTFTLEVTGGEPLLHPRLIDLLSYARDRGIPRRRLITNGFLLTPATIDALNEVGLYHLSISVDGVKSNQETEKVLDNLRTRLLWLKHAKFRVQLGAVLGSANLREAEEVVNFAKNHDFESNLNILHDEHGQLRLSPESLDRYRRLVVQVHGSNYDFRGDYRWRLVHGLDARFRCRAGSRDLYVDEFQNVPWCSQTRLVGQPKSIFDYTWKDMRRQFGQPKACSESCTVGCARRVSRMDAWRPQRAK